MKVKVTKNGPYEVTGNIPIKQNLIIADSEGHSESWKDGKEYKTGETVMLCRCGHSKDKPYCDGTHIQNDFKGEETASKNTYDDTAAVLEGPRVSLMDKEELCAVARFCDRGKMAWNYAKGDTEEDEKMATEQSCNCPSGRLTVVKDGKKIEPDLEKEIGVVEDVPADKKGPLWVKGGIEIEDSNGELYETRNRVTLCRCGNSSNMPFCDASHMKAEHMKGIDK